MTKKKTKKNKQKKVAVKRPAPPRQEKKKGVKRMKNTKGKRAKKVIDQAFGVGYAGAEAFTAKQAYDEAQGETKDKAFGALKAKFGVVGKEFGLAKDEFRTSVLIDQHKYTAGVAVVDMGTKWLGLQKRAAKVLSRFM